MFTLKEIELSLAKIALLVAELTALISGMSAPNKNISLGAIGAIDIIEVDTIKTVFSKNEQVVITDIQNREANYFLKNNKYFQIFCGKYNPADTFETCVDEYDQGYHIRFLSTKTVVSATSTIELPVTKYYD